MPIDYTTNPYKIHSLDGGGTWSMIQAIALAEMYGDEIRGRDLLAKFDLVAANSGGALVAAALIENCTLGEIKNFFADQAVLGQLFNPLSRFNRFMWGLAGIEPRFSTESKAREIARLLPSAGWLALDKLAVAGCHGAPVDFVFMTYHYDRERASMLRSNTKSLAGSFSSSVVPSLADVVHASSTAPVMWFDSPADIGSNRYWDGGLSGYNNPCLAAVVEAIANGVPREHIAVLSLGTGTTLLPIEPQRNKSCLFKKRGDPGVIADVKKAAVSILQDPPDAHSFIAHLLMGGELPASAAQCPQTPTHFVRLNPLIQPVKEGDVWRSPTGLNEAEFCKLVEMDMAVSDKDSVGLIQKFANAWIRGDAVNQSIRANRDLACEIGRATYRAASAAWKAIP